MIKIKLLKDYGDDHKGDVIQITNNVAYGLVESGVASYITVEEFVKKTEMGKTKAFVSPPSKSDTSAIHKENK